MSHQLADKGIDNFGALTSKLQHVAKGDAILVSQKPTGTLLLEDLKPGRYLYLFVGNLDAKEFEMFFVTRARDTVSAKQRAIFQRKSEHHELPALEPHPRD